MNDVFSNGSEYEFFTETFCEKCRRYGDFFAGEKPCSIEDRLSAATMDAGVFPHKYVFRENGKWTCTKFERQEASAE